ncbi:MAG TPA: Omp28 family outer membrane lipoprotein [Bacteroidia bacterium]|jgi:hypothetical protein
MKKYLLLLYFLASLIVQSCDYVSNPNETIESNPGGGPGDTTVHVRRVLVEDYTGHKCTACPQAAIAANQLKTTFGDKVVVVAVHAGFFASPTTPAGAPAGSYLVDFRTAAGTAYDGSAYFGVSNIGNPNGMINRKDYDATSAAHVKSYSSWSSEVASLLALEPIADVKITNTYNASTRSLGINVASQFLSDTLLSGSYSLVVMITQDSIVDWQLDGSTHVPDYVHQHVLRANVNGTWGESLVNGSITPNATITKNYTYTLPASYLGNPCDEDQCHVVAFIYNTANYEVLQVAEASVTGGH